MGRYVPFMQGKLAIAILVSALGSTGAFAGEISKRVACTKSEQAQQRQQQVKDQQQQPRARAQGCTVQRQIPPLVDPTPHFFL
jgi:hypothetical protein